jgi:hypothetical protein
LTARLGARAILLLGLVLGTACSQIIGIEEAHVDATLGDESPKETAGSSATSGAISGSETAGAGTGANHSNHGGTGNVPTNVAGDDAGGQPTDAPGAGGAPPAPSICERYCDKVTSNCKGKYEQYRTFDQCVEVCKRMPAGADGDDDVNTIACREKQADFAESEPFVYCKSAGPLGAGRCGSNCISYCALMQSTCTAESTEGNLEESYFETSQACVESCNAIPADETGPTQYSSSANVEPSSFVGNTVYCRTYHLAAALEQDTPDEHCPHAMGGDPCIVQ